MMERREDVGPVEVMSEKEDLFVKITHILV